MFPMMESSVVKANSKGTLSARKTDDMELLSIQEECYQKLMDIRTRLSEEFNLQAGAIMGGQVM